MVQCKEGACVLPRINQINVTHSGLGCLFNNHSSYVKHELPQSQRLLLSKSNHKTPLKQMLLDCGGCIAVDLLYCGPWLKISL